MTDEANEATAITATAPAEMSTLANAAQEAERRALLLKSVIGHIVKVCSEGNIMRLGENPYITTDGCQRIARVMGVSFDAPTIEKRWEDSKDGERVFIVDVCGQATAFGQTVFEVGGATSEDDFYRKKVEGKNGAPTTYVLRSPLMEIRLEVQKKAVANWQGRCVRTLLGLKQLTWADLENAGFSRDRAASVDYKTGRQTAGNDGAEDQAKLDEVKGKIEAQIEADAGSKAGASFVLERMTAFQGKDGKPVKGRSYVKDLSDKQVFFLWKRIKPGGDGRDAYQDAIAAAQDKYPPQAGAAATDDVPF
jgi:hypothetical protein